MVLSLSPLGLSGELSQTSLCQAKETVMMFNVLVIITDGNWNLDTDLVPYIDAAQVGRIYMTVE